VLTALPNAFDLVFVISFCAALVGLGVLGLFVENREPGPRVQRKEPIHWSEALAMLRQPGFRGLVIAGTLLALATISDAFVYLVMQHRLTFNASFIPLLYVATSMCYLLLAVPLGRLADRFGRARVFITGYVLLLLVYVGLLLPEVGPIEVIVALALFGAYYAATDGVLMALASELLHPTIRTSGMALLTTATGLAKLFASLVFGAIWTICGAEAATAVFLAGLVLAVAGAGVTLARRGRILQSYAQDAQTG
jgi:MFS family permease